MKTADLLSVQSPDQLVAMLRATATQYREDAADLQAAWQDLEAGRIWVRAATKLEATADYLEKQWAKV